MTRPTRDQTARPARYTFRILSFRGSTSHRPLINVFFVRSPSRFITTSSTKWLSALSWLVLLTRQPWTLVCLLTPFVISETHSCILFIDKAAPVISEDDYKTIKQALDVVANDTIINLVDDTPDADKFLIDALHMQIIQGCQHLRSRLTTVNGLMKRYNALNKPAATT